MAGLFRTEGIQPNYFSLSRPWSEYYSWMVAGVDLNLPGNGGGLECAGYRSIERKVIESSVMLGLAVFLTAWSLRRIKRIPLANLPPSAWTQLWLVAFSVMFGIQIGFKFSTLQLVYLLSPCHMVTAFQIYILASPPSVHTQSIYRVHIGLLNGAVLAILFPVTDTQTQPFEVELYWIQHIMMLLLPMFLSRQGEPFTPEPIKEVSFACLSYAIFFLYHIIILQPVAIFTGINLDFILCPAPSDPFAGTNYIFHACWSQAVVIFAVTRIYTIILNMKCKSEERKKCAKSH